MFLFTYRVNFVPRYSSMAQQSVAKLAAKIIQILRNVCQWQDIFKSQFSIENVNKLVGKFQTEPQCWSKFCTTQQVQQTDRVNSVNTICSDCTLQANKMTPWPQPRPLYWEKGVILVQNISECGIIFSIDCVFLIWFCFH